MVDTLSISEDSLVPYLGGRRFSECWDAYERDGFGIFENLMSQDEVDAYQAALNPYMVKTGRNEFEGANTSSASRLIVTPQYCAGWVRQIENLTLSTPPEIAAALPRRLRELIGYVDGVHPERRLT